MSRKRKQRIGYAGGGAVDNQYANVNSSDDDTVSPGTKASWTPEAYQASLWRQEAQGYARGGAVRRIGYADGGTVDDPSGAPVQPDYSNQVEQRRLEEERARAEAAAREQAAVEQQRQREAEVRARSAPAPADVARQASDATALAGRSVEPSPASAQMATAPTQPAVAPQPAPADIARQQSDETALRGRDTDQRGSETPWYRQVYDRLLSGLQMSDATGYNASPRSDVGPGAYGNTAAAPQKGLYADTPLEAHVKDIGTQFQQSWPWVDKLLNHDRAYTPDELNRMAEQHPTKDHGQALQDTFTKAELAGDHETGTRVLQTTQKLYEAARGHAVAAFRAGNFDDGLMAVERGLNQLTDEKKYSVARTNDGRIQWTITPEKAGQGEPVVKYMSPEQAMNLFSSNGGEVNHILQNGLAQSIDITNGITKPLNVPNAGERVGQSGLPYNQPRENVLNTAGGFHPDSPMGLMDRAAQATKYGRPDREATEYADRARAAVANGVPPDQVHQFLRTGGDQRGAPQQQGSEQPGAAIGPDGRPVYAPQTNIPGAVSPLVPGLHPETAFTGMKSIQDPGGRYVSGYREAQSTSKGGSSSDVSTQYGMRPPQHWVNPEADKAPPFTGYGYGERRAGSYAAPTNPQDYQPISREQGPPVPTGFTPPTPQRDVFQTARGAGAMPQAPRDYNREDALRYNTQLAEQQNQFRPPTDTAYGARGRQFNQETGYAAAMDRARAEQPQQIAAANAAESARNAEVQRNRVDIDEYGYKRPAAEIARRQEIADVQRRELELKRAPTEWRLPVAQTQQEGQTARTTATEAGKGERLQTTEAGKGERLGVAEAGKGERLQTTETGKDRRGAEREAGRNLRAGEIMAERRAHRQFLESEAAQNLLQRSGNENLRQSMTTFRTKLAQGIKPDQDEVDNYNDLKRAVQQQQNPPAATAAPAASAPPAAAPAVAAAPPGPPAPGQKWQQNRATGEWRQVPG